MCSKTKTNFETSLADCCLLFLGSALSESIMLGRIICFVCFNEPCVQKPLKYMVYWLSTLFEQCITVRVDTRYSQFRMFEGFFNNIGNCRDPDFENVF